jgi:hypothetical protein
MAYIGKVPTAVPLTSSDLADGIVTSAKISDGSITATDLDLSGTYNFTGTVTGAGATFSPRFQAHLGSTQSVSGNTETVVALSDEDFDVGGCFNNTSSTVTLNGISTPAYSFAPNVAGLYVIGAKLFAQSGSQYSIMYVYKNTTMIVENQFNTDIGAARAHYVTTVVSMNGSSDYLNMRFYVDQTKNIYNNLHNTNLFGYLLKAD